ncbi:MAG: hypothetical protein AAF266_10275, partial [Planctomycetota bacterium]
MLHHATLLALLLATQLANAGVVSRDLFEPGDGLLTYDDVNQRKWLDFTVTAGLTSDALLAALENDLTLQGFQVAASSDVNNLFRSGSGPAPSIDVPPYYTNSGDPVSDSMLPNWLALLGHVSSETESFTGGRILPF